MGGDFKSEMLHIHLATLQFQSFSVALAFSKYETTAKSPLKKPTQVKKEQEIQATASLAAAEESSVDAADIAVFSK